MQNLALSGEIELNLVQMLAITYRNVLCVTKEQEQLEKVFSVNNAVT